MRPGRLDEPGDLLGPAGFHLPQAQPSRRHGQSQNGFGSSCACLQTARPGSAPPTMPRRCAAMKSTGASATTVASDVLCAAAHRLSASATAGIIDVASKTIMSVSVFWKDLDMAHFPFVHTDILGAEPHTEVLQYTTEIRRDVDEVWATNCQFFQPQAALSATGGMMTQYMYRVANPFATILYKTCPNAANRWDVICLFVQPLDPDRCRAHPVMFLIDDVSPLTELIHFQQLIFLQDRIILENQRPALLPLEPRAEIPTRADASSIAYRRWLKEKGITYGTNIRAA